MAEQGEAGDKDDKTEEPTAKRLEDAHKRGDIIYSPEAGAWLMLATGALLAAAMGPATADALGRLLIVFLEQPHALASDGPGLMALGQEIGLKVGAALGLAALALLAAGLVARFVQDAPVWAPEKLAPTLDKLNLAEGVKRTFGAPAFANLGKGLLKFVVVGAAMTVALWPHDAAWESAPLRDIAAFWPFVQEKLAALFMAMLAAFGVLAGVDYFLTRRAYMERLRMSKQELKDEHRESEGDPAVKAKLRQVRMERSRRRMIAQVPNATLIITNPTHYAVALRYERGETDAPMCLAKGVDEVALIIREVAAAADVPIVEDPPLARALYASAELDQPIPRVHFEAVAKVIGYVLRLAERRRKRPRARPNQPN